LRTIDAVRKSLCNACDANIYHRVRYQVQYANPLNFAVEANKLASIIKLYNQDSDSLFVR
jgi:hypothetical protein